MFVGFELLRGDASELVTVLPGFQIILKLYLLVLVHCLKDHALETHTSLDVVLCASQGRKGTSSEEVAEQQSKWKVNLIF